MGDEGLPQVRISLSGRMSIEVDDTVVEENRLGGARARLAFAVLVLERPRPVDRHHLAEVLWPDALPASWEAALRVVMSRVRAFLGAAGLPAAAVLTSSYGCYRLSLPDDVVVDVEAAAAAVDEAEAAWAAGTLERAITAAGETRAITGRPFIAGAEGPWLDAARRRQGSHRLRALDVMVRASIQLGETALAIDAAQELLGLDPYRDASHVLVMAAHRAAGNRAEALRAYGWCRHVLAEELGVDPSPETEALYRSLLREEHGGNQDRDLVWLPSAADLPPNNLPSQLSTFVGRERELREIRKLLEGDRLVTLTGPAGSGKTRVALEVAARSMSAHADGSWLVDLAPLAPTSGDDEAVVARTFAAAVGVVEQPPRALVDTLVDHLRQREAILVVDNCEHVLGASAALVDALLRACPLLWVLATSREPLGVPGEVLWRVPSLSTPAPGEPCSLGALLEYEAPRLFVDRSRALVADRELTDADAAALAQVCVRLDGIPLAIELAAACTTALSVQQIAARLDDRFRLLTLGSRTAQARHQTLQRAVEWSHELLTPRQQVLLRRLSVLAGGFTLEAAEDVGTGEDLVGHVGGDIDRGDVLDLLIGLVNTSLVVSHATTGAPVRYGFLETIRHFARDRLVESGEEVAVRDAHLAWCVSLVTEAEPKLSGPDQEAWFGRIDVEIDNLRAALDWALRQGAAEPALRIAGALTLYWHVRGYYPEGRRWAESALAIGLDAPPLVRAKALWGLGFLSFYLGDVAVTVPAIEECLTLARAEGAVVETARALAMMGELASLQDAAAAHRILSESAELAREAGDSWCLSHSLASRAWAEFYRGPSPVGRPLIAEAMEVARAANDTRNLLRGSVCMAWGALLEGDYSTGGDAERALELGSTQARRLGDIGWTGLMLNGQGELAWRRGDYVAAGRLLDESAEIGRRLGSPYALAPPYGLLGRRAKAMGNLEEAAAWFEAALDISRRAGLHLFVPWWVWGRADVYRLAGDYQSAATWLAEARTVAEAVGNELVVALTIWARGAIAREEGRLGEADGLHREALRRRQAVGDGDGTLDSLEALAGLAGTRGQAARAARLLAAAGAHRLATRCARSVGAQAGFDADVAAARAGLPDAAFAQAWAEGQRLSRQEAVALALGEPTPVSPPPVEPPPPLAAPAPGGPAPGVPSVPPTLPVPAPGMPSVPSPVPPPVPVSGGPAPGLPARGGPGGANGSRGPDGAG